MKQCICQDNIGDMSGIIVVQVNNLSHTILMAKRLSHGKSLATIKNLFMEPTPLALKILQSKHIWSMFKSLPIRSYTVPSGNLINPCVSIISLGISMGQWEVLTTTTKTSSIGFIEDEPFQLVGEACLLSVLLGVSFGVGSNVAMDRSQGSVGHVY